MSNRFNCHVLTVLVPVSSCKHTSESIRNLELRLARKYVRSNQEYSYVYNSSDENTNFPIGFTIFGTDPSVQPSCVSERSQTLELSHSTLQTKLHTEFIMPLNIIYIWAILKIQGGKDGQIFNPPPNTALYYSSEC